MLEVRNISKKYKDVAAVDNVSFSLMPGQILGLIGANGAGKSTCVSMLATLIKPDTGSILFEGRDVIKNPEIVRESLGYVPQDIALYETLSGLDNLRFWGSCYHLRGNELAGEIARVAGIIGFDEKTLKKRVSEYSGGMKRRLNIAVALLHHPRLVILDEPTVGVDLQSEQQIFASIREVAGSGSGVIYVGHQMDDVQNICTHLCLLKQGRVVACGEKNELLAKEDVHSLRELFARYA